MSELMSASEARKIIDQAQDRVSIKLKRNIEEVILAAIGSGNSSVSLDVPQTHVKSMKAWLESLGYTVDCGSEYRGTWFSVSW